MVYPTVKLEDRLAAITSLPLEFTKNLFQLVPLQNRTDQGIQANLMKGGTEQFVELHLKTSTHKSFAISRKAIIIFGEWHRASYRTTKSFS